MSAAKGGLVASPVGQDGGMLEKDVVIQRVRTSWSKASRGGVSASLRNACPIAVRMPSTDVAWLSVEMAEERDWLPFLESGAEVPQAVVDELSLKIQGDTLSLLPQVSPFWMPKRHRRPPRLRLPVGAWARWTVNYRLGLDRGWVYGLVTWNVAFRVDDWSSDFFLGDPDRTVEELAALR